MKKWRRDLSSAKPANMRSEIFCLLFSLLKHIDKNVQIYKSVCCVIWMWNFVTHGRRYIGWGCSEARCWGSFLGQKLFRENCIMRIFMICNPHQILFWWSDKEERYGQASGIYGGERGTYRVLVWKPEGKRQLRRPRHRWEDNIKIYLL
jgi:hypothetical protein